MIPQPVHCIQTPASLFTTDTSTLCAFNITPSKLETESQEDVHDHPHNNTGIHFYSKHKYRDTFGDAHVQYHDFENGDAFVYKDKYTALLQQELQNPKTIQYNDKGMLPAQMMDDTPIQVFIDNGATPFSHLVLTINIQYYKNIPKQKTLHPSTQEVVQDKCKAI